MKRGFFWTTAVASAVYATTALAAGIPSSPVADAARRGDLEGARALLRQGADVNAAQGDGMTALHWAAQRGEAEMANMLVAAGANVSAFTRIGHYTPLHVASAAAKAELVAALIGAGAEVNRRASVSGATALHLAAAAGSADAVRRLIGGGAEVDSREAEWGQTPLMFAAAQGRAEVVRVLLERGADPGVASKVIDVPAHEALKRAALDRQRKVLEASVTKGQPAQPAQTRAAVQAARELYASGKLPERREGDEDVAAGNFNPANPEEINPPVATKGGLTALLHAVRQGHREATRVLLEGGASINQVGAGDRTSPLLMAVINGHFDLALFLVERGADPNLAQAGTGVTPLWAVLNAQWQPRTRFPQPQEKDHQQSTYLEAMKALLDKGADADARLRSHPWIMVYTGCGNRNCGLADTSGSTAFWRAAYATDVAAMRLLVAYGADPDIPTVAPRRPVRRGPDAGAAGAPVARPEGAGGPVAPVPAPAQERFSAPPIPYGGPGALPIHAAAGVEYGEGFAGNAHRHAPDGWLPAVKYLVEELGADVNARDNDGYAPLHHAAARGDDEMILYLVSKGADVKAVARSGQTTADMANGPVQRVSPFPATVALLEKLGSKNSKKCVTC